MPPRVAIQTLGCKVNAYDGATIAERLRAAGCEIVAPETAADVVVVNSCTVTDVADAESRQLARRARRRNPAARVILTGCYAQTRPADAASVEAVDYVIGVGRIDAIVEAALAPAPRLDRVDVTSLRREQRPPSFGARTFGGHTRAFLKVQEGCDLFCSFCIIPMARGRSRSLPPREVASELAALASAGFEEVVLTGVHLGGYGQDLVPRLDLADLVAALAERALVPRLRISSIDPHEVTGRLIDLVRTAPGLCPHLHIPLQAADDGVLRAMRRRYDVAQARERLAMVRALLPEAAIGTDLITGFPGEDDAAFERTLEFVRGSPLTYLHVFPYSVRSGTSAAKMAAHVSPETITARAKALRDAGAALKTSFARRFQGGRAEMLVESSRDPSSGALRGYTRNYLRATLDGPDAWMGRRIPVTLAVSDDGRVHGRAAA